MTKDEFLVTLDGYAEHIAEARERKDIETLKVLAEDCRDFLRLRARDFKGILALCEKPTNGFYKAEREKAKKRAEGRCEVGGKRCAGGGTHAHHLCRRGRLRVYHLAELLLWTCWWCHNTHFHG